MRAPLSSLGRKEWRLAPGRRSLRRYQIRTRSRGAMYIGSPGFTPNAW